MNLSKSALWQLFAGSFTASLILGILNFVISVPHGVSAASQDLALHADVTGVPLPGLGENEISQEEPITSEEPVGPSYEASLPVFEQAIIRRETQEEPQDLENNTPKSREIKGGETHYWKLTQDKLSGASTLDVPILPPGPRVGARDVQKGDDNDGARSELRRRQVPDRAVYITLNVCDQPIAKVNGPTGPTGPPPPLRLFISYNSDTNKRPGPNFNGRQNAFQAEGGYAGYNLTTSTDSFFGVSADDYPGYDGSYTYEMTASLDVPYTSYLERDDLFYVDSDTNAGFFVTHDLKDTLNSNTDDSRKWWMNSGAPFGIFIHNQNDSRILGLQRSYCGLKKHAQIKGNIAGLPASDSEAGVSLMGGDVPKQQILIKNLNGSSSYLAMMALGTSYSRAGPGNPGGGGAVWKSIAFQTKSDGNCQLLYNLSFCNTVSYAVPSNGNRYSNLSALAHQYDTEAKRLFQSFSNSLEQVPCDTTSSAQYSLAVTCDNCTTAYKRWLCAVTIPRCEDYSSSKPYLQVRGIGQNFTNGSMPTDRFGDTTFSPANKSILYMNSSRFPLIDESVQPGPYKEVLPCIDLCYGLVQSCPASLQFACPLPGKGRNQSYSSGVDGDGRPVCNIPGSFGVMNAARKEQLSVGIVLAALIAFGSNIIGS